MQGIFEHIGLMCSHGDSIQVLQVVHRCGQSDGTGYVRGAGLEAIRQPLIAGAGQTDLFYHFTATLPGRHGFQQFPAPDRREIGRAHV